jgi:hypothetical protein
MARGGRLDEVVIMCFEVILPYLLGETTFCLYFV